MSNVEKLRQKFEEMKTEGLLDLKVQLSESAKGAEALEDLCGEVLAVIAAHEEGRTVPLGDKLK